MKTKRPEVTQGETTKIKLDCGNIYITVNKVNGDPFEIFIHLGKAGGCAYSQLEALARMVSLAMQYKIPNEDIIKQLEGIRCPSATIYRGIKYFSCADAIAKVLK